MDPRLFEAARRGDIGALNELLVDDPFILERNSLAINSENCLHVATLAMNVDFVKKVVRLKPELAWRLNGDGFSPIHLASANGSAEIVGELLSSNKELGRLNSSDGRTALHCASITGSADVVRELVTACPENINQVTVRGETALHLAVKNSQLEAFRLLIEILMQMNMKTNKELINAKDEDGNTILHLATSRKQYQTMKLLLGESDGILIEKVEVNVTNNNGFTALDVFDVLQQIVIEPGDNHIRQLLQSAGARRSQDLSLVRPSTNVSRRPVVDDNNADTMLSLLHDLKKLWHVLVQNICTLNPIRFWREFTNEAENLPAEKQNALLVVAVLIADLTYNAVLNPPGGFNKGDDSHDQHYNGMANMGSDMEIFILVAVLNSVGFFAALIMIYLLTARIPFRVLFRLLLFAMASSYICVLFFISPIDLSVGYLVIVVMILAVVTQILAPIVRWARGGGVHSIGRNSSLGA